MKKLLKIEVVKKLNVVLGNCSNTMVVLAGCGGTGGFIAWNIARIASHMLNKHKKLLDITFVDPDIVEKKNVGRQNFCEAEIGLPKAEALSVRYNLAYGLNIKYLRGEVGELTHELIKDQEERRLIVIGAVDTKRGRRQIVELVDAYDTRCEVWWLDCGNEKDAGQVLLGNKFWKSKRRFNREAESGRCSQIPMPSIQQPDLVRGKDEVKRIPCAEQVALEAQSLMVNQVMGTMASQYLYKMIVKQKVDIYRTYVDLKTMGMRSDPITAHVWDGIVGRYDRERGYIDTPAKQRTAA